MKSLLFCFLFTAFWSKCLSQHTDNADKITVVKSEIIPKADCATDQVEFQLFKMDSLYKKKRDSIEYNIQTYLQTNPKNINKSGHNIINNVYSIAVVFHVMNLGEPIGVGTNISDGTIQQALSGLNDRFRNFIGNGIDVQMQFCLASQDPNGNSSTGINRIDASNVLNYISDGISDGNCSSSADEIAIKNLSRWPNTSYVNIWIVNKICNGAWGGYAHFPGGSSLTDGIVVVYNQFGYNDATLAHEMGHAFDLFHTFQGSINVICPSNIFCSLEGDKICDTPPHRKGDCGLTNPCSSSGNWNNSRYNYLSYCYYTWTNNDGRFTQDQIDRMRATLNTSPRSDLLNSQGCNTVCVDQFESNNSCSSGTPIFANALGAGTSNYTIDANIDYAGDQDWYSFQLASCGTMTITLSNLPFNYDMELYGTCGGLALQGQYHLNTDNEQIVLSNTSSNTITYRIKVYAANSANSTVASCYHLNFQWASSNCSCSSSNTQAANTCPTATLINPTTSCNFLSYTTCGATSSAINQCSGNQDDDVWLYFNATQPSYSINVLGSSDYDAAFQIFEQDQLTGICGGSMPSVICQNISSIGQLESATVSTTIGKKYFIRVWHVGTGAGSTGNFQICVFNSCPSPPVPTSTIASNISQTGFQANWNQVNGATAYLVDVATNSSFTNFVSGFTNLNVGNVNSVFISGLSCNTSYYYRIKSFNSSCSSNNSNMIQVATSACQVSAPNLLCQSGALTVNGNIIDASVTIANNGTSSAINTVILLKLFTDPSLTHEVAVIGVQTISFLQAGFTATTPNAQYNLCAAGIPDGTYYLAYYIDYYNNIPELNESDNGWCSVSPLQLIANCCANPNPPTSQFGSLSCPGTALYNQSSITLSWSNAGPYNYDIELLEFPFDANSIIFSQSCIQAQSISVPNYLLAGHLYAWRIRTTTDCSTCNGNYSPLYYFHIAPTLNQSGPLNICNGIGTTISTTLINPPLGTNLSYQWFKVVNGTPTPVGNNSNSYFVTSNGSYNVRLNYSGSTICSGSINTAPSFNIGVTVANAPIAPILNSNSPICVGSNLNINATGPLLAQYFWSGPNGFSATNNSIYFNGVDQFAAGTYSCYVIDSSCQSPLSIINISVSPAPFANFTFSIQNSTVNFVNSSTNATSYNWTFGDGQFSAQVNPSHNYVSNSNYNVCLSANSFGCNSSSNCQSITLGNIYEPTQPTFSRLYQDTIPEHVTWLCSDIVQSPIDSGYIILGQYQETLNSTSTTQYFKTDKNGKLIWIRELPANFSSGIYQIIKSHGGYLISSYYGGTSNLFEIDEQGNKLWGKQYSNSFLSKIIKINSGGYVAINSTSNRFEIFNIDNSGNINWQKGYQYNLYTSTTVNVRNLIQSSSGDFYLTGFIGNSQVSGPNGRDGLLIKLNSNGNHAWSKYYNSGTNLRDQFTDLVEDVNQYIIITGYSSNATLGGLDGLLFKLDQSGSLITSFKTGQNLTSLLRKTQSNQIAGLFNGTTIVEFNSNLNIVNQKSVTMSGIQNFYSTYDNNFAIVAQYLYNVPTNQYRYGFFKMSFSNASCSDGGITTLSTSVFVASLLSTSPVSITPNTTASNFPINPLLSYLKDTSLCIVCIPEICGNGIDDDCDNQIDENCTVTLQLNAFIEGFYIGNNQMKATIDSFNQPLLCDTFIVELHTSSPPYNYVYSDTSILSTSGIGELVFPIGILGNNYYIVFRHRNGLQTWSSAPVSFGTNSVSYSFINPISNAFGNNLIDLHDGNFAIMSGDVNSDGVINQLDFTSIENSTLIFLSGYFNEDITGDWLIESSDFSLIENNIGKIVLRP